MITPTRSYTAEETAALRTVLGQDPSKRGPAQFACGPWWPDELERRADAAEKSVPKLRLAARALRREIAADPRCAS